MAFLLLGVLSQDLLDVALGQEGTEALSLYLVSGQARSSLVAVETVAYGLHIRLLLCPADARGENISVPVCGAAALWLRWAGASVLPPAHHCTLHLQVGSFAVSSQPFRLHFHPSAPEALACPHVICSQLFQRQHAMCVHCESHHTPPFNSLQNSTHSIDQTEKAATGEAGVRAGGGQDQKGSVYVWG